MNKINTLLVLCCGLILSISNSIASNPAIDSLLKLLQEETSPLPPSRKAELLHETGVEFHFADQQAEAEKYLLQSLQLATANEFKVLVMENQYFLGVVHFWQSQYGESVKHLQQSLESFPEIVNTEDSIFIFDQMGSSYFYMGDLEKSLENRLQSLDLTQRYGDSTYLASSLYALAEIAREQKDYGQALEYAQQALSISERADDKENINYCLDLIGDIYHETNELEKALAFKIRSCEIISADLKEYSTAYCDHNLALTYAKMGNTLKAIQLFSKALTRQEKSGQLEEAAYSRTHLGELIALDGDCARGLAMMQQSLADTDHLGINPLKRDIYQKLFTTSKHCGRYEEISAYQEKYYQFRDSISNEKTKMRMANLNAMHELGNLKVEVLEKEKRLSTLYIVILCGAIFLLLLLAVGIFWLYRKQRSYNRLQAERSAVIFQQNEALESANQKLVSFNEELEHFTFVMSHDLKAPLRTIGSYASLINRRYKQQLDKEGQMFLSYITEDAQHLYKLLEDIINYSRVDKSKEVFKEVDLNKNMRLVLRLLNSAVEERKAKIEISTLPIVKGHDMQLMQLFQNLIDNALKFVPNDRQPLIKVSALEESKFSQFSISDNGIGIDPELQSKIFAPFKRLHKRDEYKGTGIGLAICQKIVERHGGKIWVESDGQNGTTFHFTIQNNKEKEI